LDIRVVVTHQHYNQETWLSRDILSLSIQPAGFSVFRADRKKITLREEERRRILFGYSHSHVKIPPQADTTTALKELHWTLCKLETTYPEAAFIVQFSKKMTYQI
jgi:hypothetical protein